MSKTYWWLAALAATLVSVEPARATETVLSRRDYVRAVLERNPSMDSARASLNAALARVRQAGAFMDPMVEVVLAPLSFAPPLSRAGYEVGLRQALPWFGKRALERDVANAEAAAARHDVEATRQMLALSAVTLYSEYYVVARSLEINAQHAELLTALRHASLAAVESGRGNVTEPLQVDAELARLEQDTTTLHAERDVLRAQMNELLHRAPETPLAPAAAPAPSGANTEAVPKLPAASQAPKRPELDAIRDRIRAQEARASAAERERYPNLTISTSYSSMWEMPEHRWSVGLGVSLPVQVGRRRAAVDEARAMQSYYESELRRMSDSMKTERYVALRRVQESQQTLAIFEHKTLALARQRVEAQRTAFVSSLGSLSMLLEAERALRSLELEYESARASYERRLAELERSEGKVPGTSDAGAH